MLCMICVKIQHIDIYIICDIIEHNFRQKKTALRLISVTLHLVTQNTMTEAM